MSDGVVVYGLAAQFENYGSVKKEWFMRRWNVRVIWTGPHIPSAMRPSATHISGISGWPPSKDHMDHMHAGRPRPIVNRARASEAETSQIVVKYGPSFTARYIGMHERLQITDVQPELTRWLGGWLSIPDSRHRAMRGARRDDLR